MCPDSSVILGVKLGTVGGTIVTKGTLGGAIDTLGGTIGAMGGTIGILGGTIDTLRGTL